MNDAAMAEAVRRLEREVEAMRARLEALERRAIQAEQQLLQQRSEVR